MRLSKERKRQFLLIGFILIGVLLYANALDNSFHFDDDYIIQQDGLHHISHLSSIWTTASHTRNILGRGHYRPLVLTTYLLNYSLGGLNPIGYHIVNLLIHILTSFMVALVLDRLTGRLAIGALSGLLFLIHPFNSEAVNYVTARSSQMYALFYLLSFYAYLRYRLLYPQAMVDPSVEYQQKGTPSSRYPWLGLSFLSFILSMLSKEMAVTLPVTLFLYEWLIGPDKGLRNNMRHIWMPLCTTLGVVVSYLAIRKTLTGAVLGPSMVRNLVSQLATESVILIRTLGLILYPSTLAIVHKVEAYKTFLAWPVVVACIVLLVGLLGIAVWWGISKVFMKRLWAFLLVWFFVALSPLVIVRLNAMLQENRAYLAMVGLTGLAAIGLIWLLDWAKRRGAIFLKVAWGGIVVLMLIYMALTFQRNRAWQDDVTLWTDAVQKEPDFGVSRYNLASAYLNSGRVEQAAEEFRRFWLLEPTNPDAVYDLGLIMEKQERYDEAREWLLRTIRLDPQYSSAYFLLGRVEERQGHWDLAVWAYRQVVKLTPGNPEAHYRLAEALIHTGQHKEAIKEYETVLEKGSSDQKLTEYIRAKLARIRGDSRG